MEEKDLILQVRLLGQQADKNLVSYLSEKRGIRLILVGVCQAQGVYFFKKNNGETFSLDELNEIKRIKNIAEANLLKVE